MFRTTISAVTAVLFLSGAVLAQTPADQAAFKAKRKACQAEANAKKITDKAERKAFITECAKK